MPTDLPPDYVPKPFNDPNNPADPNSPGSTPAYPPVPGEDSPGEPVGIPQPGPGVGIPGPGGDVVDPPGWSEPPVLPGGFPSEVPTPAGTPTF